MKRNAVVYSRISKDREGAGLGVERQRADCVALAASLGWTVVQEFSDNDISAYGGRLRPSYEAMCAMVDAGQADAILSWHTDRLHRSPRELEGFIDLCERRSVEIRTVQAGTIDLSNASGRMVARMLGAAARHEVEHSVERQRRAKLAAAVAGKYRGGRRAFGYEPDGMTIRPAEADALRSATTDFLAGVSLGQLSRRWNEQGLRTSMSGGEWTARTLRNVLLRPRNAALITHDGQIIGSAQWPAVVPEGDFYAVQSVLRGPGRRDGKLHERKYLGVGVYVCGVCGAHMRSHFGAAGKRQTRGYVCSASPHLHRVGEPLDEYINALVLKRLSQPDAALVLGGGGVDLGALQRNRDGLQERLDELAAMFAEGALDGTQLKAGTAVLRDKLTAADAQVARARSSSVLADLVLSGDDLVSAWGTTSIDVRGKVVNALMTVTVLKAPRGRQPGGEYFNPQYVRIEWKVAEA
jgi:site-specific DNA recombinase